MRGVSVCVLLTWERGVKTVSLCLGRPSRSSSYSWDPTATRSRASPPSKDGADQIRPSEAKTEAETGDDVTTSQGRNDTPPQAPAPHKTPSDRAILTLLLASGQITQAEYMAYEYNHGKNRSRQRIAFAATANFMASSSRLPPDPVCVCDMSQRIEAMWDDGKWSEGSWHAFGGGLGCMGSRGADKLTLFRCGRE